MKIYKYKDDLLIAYDTGSVDMYYRGVWRSYTFPYKVAYLYLVCELIWKEKK